MNLRALFQAGATLDPIVIGGLALISILAVAFGSLLGYFFGNRKTNTAELPALKSRLNGHENGNVGERFASFFRLAQTLSSTLNYERVLDTVLDLSLNTFSDEGGPNKKLVCGVLLFNADELVVQTARRFTPGDMRATLPGLNGCLGSTISRGEPTIVSDPATDPELGRLVALRSCQSAYCIPLRNGLDVYGILMFAHPEAAFFDADRRETLHLIADQAMKTMQNARLYQDLEAEKERMSEIQENARKKLARDLHDGPTQSVAAIAMRVNFARRLIERDPGQAAEELFKIEDLARRTTKEIRHMLFTLRPLVLETKGLEAAMQAMAAKMRETFEQNVILDLDEDVILQLDITRQGTIFYMAEEAVNNARKHARAKHIWVRLKQARNDIALLEIRDDGVGFDVKKTQSSYENRGSLGMINLRERAESINGVLQMKSQTEIGTRIRVWIPLTEEAAERMWQRA